MTASAAASVPSARSEISARLPIGVATTCKPAGSGSASALRPKAVKDGGLSLRGMECGVLDVIAKIFGLVLYIAQAVCFIELRGCFIELRGLDHKIRGRTHLLLIAHKRIYCGYIERGSGLRLGPSLLRPFSRAEREPA